MCKLLTTPAVCWRVNLGCLLILAAVDSLPLRCVTRMLLCAGIRLGLTKLVFRVTVSVQVVSARLG